MGYEAHRAFVVMAHGYPAADAALDAVKDLILNRYEANPELPCTVTPTVEGINGIRSFAVLPDGSKEGWDTSNAVDRIIADAKAMAEQYRYTDGGNAIAWGEMQFYDDNAEHWVQSSQRAPM